MKLIDDASGRNILRHLSLRGRLTILLTFVVLYLMVGSVAFAGSLDRVALFNIKAQTLEDALVQFGVQAHIQIVFASKASMSQERAVALIGTCTGRQALAKLLQGSNFRFVEAGNTAEIVPSAWTPLEKQRIAPTLKAKDPPAESNSPEKGTAARKKNPALQEVIVTGTHIQGAPVSSPLVRITRQDIDRSGYTTVGAVIRSLPENFGNTGPQTPITSAPNENPSLSGAPSPNLYGLGAGSTLTLVDSQRLAVDSITGSVDISLIPLAVVDHIDVLTDGASAIYGSDAVAGVVNMVLKRSFNGVKTSILGGGTADGGGMEREINQMLGKTWSTGGVLLDYESDQQDPILASERDYTNSAAPSTTTLAGNSRSSFFLNANQDIGPASAFITGLYTHRTVSDAFGSGSLSPVEQNEVSVHQYAASGGLDAPLASKWFLSVVGDLSEDRTVSAYTLLGNSPTAFPLDLEEGQLKSLEVTGDGPVLTTPSGTMRSAVGAGYRSETYNDEHGGVSDIPGARRTVKYAYGELDVPLIAPSNIAWRRELAVNLSGRFERYSDFGDEFVPKLGLVYAPFGTLKIRGTWGKAFRAPPLFDIYENHALLYYGLPDALSPTGRSDVLLTAGGNRELKPESAKTWTIGIDYDPEVPSGLKTSVSYFDIEYRNRISQISNVFTALTDPLNAPFVTRAPSEAYVDSLIHSATTFLNLVGSPVNPADVPAVVDDGYVNVASENLVGADISVAYRIRLGFGEVEPFINGTVLDLKQMLVPGAPEREVSGEVFEPAKGRARGGVSWVAEAWEVSGMVNYSGAERNTYQPTLPHVASWTTVDFSATWYPIKASAIGELALSLSVENAFNRDPPFVQFDQFVPGIHYDPLNANVLGRVIRVGGAWSFQ